MEIISNAKIEKIKSDMDKTRAKIAEYQAKYREQEKRLRIHEDLEIVARYRQMRGNEELAAKFKADPAGVIAYNEQAAGEEDIPIDTSIDEE